MIFPKSLLAETAHQCLPLSRRALLKTWINHPPHEKQLAWAIKSARA
jgi:hypothetical protein